MRKQPKHTARRIITCAVVLILFATIGLGAIYLTTGAAPTSIVMGGIPIGDIASAFVGFVGDKPEIPLYSTQTWDDTIEVQHTERFFVEVSSYFEPQIPTQCAGFAAAYILRCLGQDAKGTDCYERMGQKMDNGYVRINGIAEFLDSCGVPSQFKFGTVGQMKTRLSAGNPVIVLIGNDDVGRHFITIVGYDADSVYAYDSNKSTDSSKGYNRVLTNENFEDLLENENHKAEKVFFYAYVV